MTFQDAANRQHLHHSFYTVWLVKGDSEKVELGHTQGKSGNGLMRFLRRETVQAKLTAELGADSLVEVSKKTATALHLSNGWRIEFGKTIRQEAS